MILREISFISPIGGKSAEQASVLFSMVVFSKQRLHFSFEYFFFTMSK